MFAAAVLLMLAAPTAASASRPDADCLMLRAVTNADGRNFADLRVTPETVEMPIRYALSNNIGLGGHNGAIIFKRYDGD